MNKAALTKQLHEKLEKLTGKKVVFKEAVIKNLVDVNKVINVLERFATGDPSLTNGQNTESYFDTEMGLDSETVYSFYTDYYDELESDDDEDPWKYWDGTDRLSYLEDVFTAALPILVRELTPLRGKKIDIGGYVFPFETNGFEDSLLGFIGTKGLAK